MPGTSVAVRRTRLVTADPDVRYGHVLFHQPWLGRREIRAVAAALRQGWLQGNGPIGRAVEAQLRRLLGVRHALLMSSCTAAVEAAFSAVGVKGGEVILPSFAFPSLAAAVIGQSARPVFADIDPMALTLDPTCVRQALSAATRAILYVDYAGFPRTIRAIRDLAQEAGVPLIEDAAHALGSRLQERPLGAWGTAGCLSFHETKLVTCGEGGALVTDDERLAEDAAVWREYGTNRSAFFQGRVDHYEWLGPGTSAFLAEPLAAILQEQLSRFPEILARRRAIAQRYLRAFRPLVARKVVRMPQEPPEGCSNWQTFFLILPSQSATDGLIAGLAARGIDARRHFVPLHRSRAAQHGGYDGCVLPVTDSVASRLVRLPIYPSLTAPQQRAVINGVRELLAGAGPAEGSDA